MTEFPTVPYLIEVQFENGDFRKGDILRVDPDGAAEEGAYCVFWRAGSPRLGVAGDKGRTEHRVRRMAEVQKAA